MKLKCEYKTRGIYALIYNSMTYNPSSSRLKSSWAATAAKHKQ